MTKEKKLAALLSIVVAGVAFAVILGWFFDITLLKSVLPHYVTMKFNTAIGLLLSAAGYLHIARSTTIRKGITTTLASVVFLISLLTMLEYIIDTNLGIDELFVDEYLPNPLEHEGRMAFTTATCLVVLSAGIFATLSSVKWWRRVVQFFLHCTTVLSLIAIMGYVFRVPDFYSISLLSSMAVHTAVSIFMLSTGASALIPEAGFATIFIGKEVGNIMARRLFPFTFISVLVLSLIRLKLHWGHTVTVEMGIALYGLAFIIISLLLIGNTANKLNNTDKKRLLAEHELRRLNAELEVKVAQRTEELMESNKRSRIFVNQAPSAIAMFDRDMRYIAASDKWMKDYGLEGQQIIGKSHYEVFPEIGEDWKQIHRDCMEGAINRNDNAPFVRADGSIQWLVWDVRPWYRSDNSIGGIIMYTDDITNRKGIEQQLAESEAEFRGAFEHSATGVAIVSLFGKWLKVNKAICNILGYTEGELLKLTFQEITHPDDLTADTNLLKELIAGKIDFYHLEKRYLHKSGSYVWAMLSVSLVKDANGKPKHFVSQLTDINMLHITRDKLQDALSKVEAVLEASTQVSIISTDAHGIINTFNNGAENLLGYTREEVIYKLSPGIIHVPAEVATRAAELAAELGRPINGFDVFTALCKTQPFETREWTYVRKDGTTFPVQLTVTAIRDGNDIVGYLGIAADISKLKAYEKEVTTLLDVTKEQNERLKNFAHIVSHNLRSHSGNISALLGLFVQEQPEQKDNELIMALYQAADNLEETIAHLNEVVIMNTDTQQNLKPLPLYNYIVKAQQSVQALMDESDIDIQIDVDKSINVAAIEAYLDSIVLNLITNAIKYKDGSKAHPYLKIFTTTEDSYRILHFEDNGIGMDMSKVQHKLFGMYKTFHSNKDARGIGLFITKNQIEAMGGKIAVTSDVGVGTTFKIYLKNEEN